MTKRENFEKQNYYCVIPTYILFDDRLSSTEKLLYAHISSLANEKGFCYASNNYFVKMHKRSKNHISKCISNLVHYDYIRIEYEYYPGTKQIMERKLYINPFREDIKKSKNFY